MTRETTLLICMVLALTTLGVLMVYSASATDPKLNGLILRHIPFVFLGLLCMALAAHFDYHRLSDPLIFRFIVGVAILWLILVLVPQIGVRVDGGQRWIRFAGIGFQPSELGKFALILLLAVKLTENQEHVQSFFTGFVPPMVVAAFFAGLVVLERDLGVPVVMMLASCVMLCVAGVRLRYLFFSALPGGVAVGFLIKMAPHRIERLLAFLNPWAYRDSAGWQLIQSLSAFAQGGVFGRGPGAGEQKLGYLPAAHTDFIFSLIGEEFGLIGSLITVVLFAALLFAIYRIAINAQDLFGGLLASGIGALIGVQTILIMAITTGMLPTKGLPLPFISSGGTAIVVYLAMSGIVVNIGAQACEPIPQKRLVPSIHTR